MKSAMLIKLKNGDQFLAKPKSINPFVYLPVFEVAPLPVPFINTSDPYIHDESTGSELNTNNSQSNTRPEIIHNILMFYFETLNGTEIYRKSEDVEGWYLVRYDVGAQSYFVYPRDPKSKGNDSAFRGTVPFHI